MEFLIPELGRDYDKAREVKKLYINAQGLRYLNLLADYPKERSKMEAILKSLPRNWLKTIRSLAARYYSKLTEGNVP